MARSSLYLFGAAHRREGVPWSAALGLVVAAILVNAIGLYGTGTALALALKPVDRDEDEDVVEFDLVEPPSQRLVNSESANDQRPELSERVAEHDSDVEHETQMPPQPDEAPSDPSVAPKPTPAQRGWRGDGDRGYDQGKHSDENTGEQSGAGDDSLATAEDGATASQGGDAGAQRGQPDRLASLGGSTSALSDTFGRPSGNARLRDVDEGSSNMLDNKRHLYASFFSRMSDRVREHWRPQKVLDSADPDGRKYGRSRRVTGLMVRLDMDGNILKIVVIQPCGAPILDDEAVRAMRAAGPFPNMPTGLADANGHIEFNFGFHLLEPGVWNIFRL